MSSNMCAMSNNMRYKFSFLEYVLYNLTSLAINGTQGTFDI